MQNILKKRSTLALSFSAMAAALLVRHGHEDRAPGILGFDLAPPALPPAPIVHREAPAPPEKKAKRVAQRKARKITRRARR